MPTLVQKIKQLCIEHRFDEAIAKTNEFPPEQIHYAIQAELLCIEYEQACIRDGTIKAGSSEDRLE